MVYETSCGIIPFRWFEGRLQYLLLHSVLVRNPEAAWEFPKGSREAGEADLETAMRELREETGLTAIHLIPRFREQVHYQYRREGRDISKTVIFFTGEVRDWSALPPTAPTREHGPHPRHGVWHRWSTEKQAMRMLFHPGMRQLLARAARRIHENERMARELD